MGKNRRTAKMQERFTYKDGKYYDKEQELGNDDICNLLNDNNKEINRLLEVINDLHTDLRNHSRRKRQLEQLIIQLNDIITSYQLIYETLKER